MFGFLRSRDPSLRIEWTASGEDICKLISVGREGGGAYTIYRKKPLVIWTARPSVYRPNDKAPGTIINIDDDGCLLVALEERSLLIQEVLHRRKVRETDEFNFRLGEVFR